MEPSPPGLLANQIFKKLGSHVALLTNEKLLGLLEHINGGTVTPAGTPLQDNKVGQERDMAISEVKSRLNSLSKYANLHDELIAKDVFRIGLRLQCPRCTRTSWMPLDKLDTTLACPKCLESFSAVGNINNGTWSYKTAGPFSVPNYAEGAYSVLLALDFFDDRRLSGLRTSPVASFKATAKGGDELEADFALFWQEEWFGEAREGVLFGECKTYGLFNRKDFDRMSHLAKKFPGAVIVFATLRKELTNTEIRAITKLAKAGRKYWKAERPLNPVLVLTGNELLSTRGPPGCWDEATKSRFGQNCHGLAEICNVTQQLYLKLPPWQATWQKAWTRKLERKQPPSTRKESE